MLDVIKKILINRQKANKKLKIKINEMKKKVRQKKSIKINNHSDQK